MSKKGSMHIISSQYRLSYKVRALLRNRKTYFILGGFLVLVSGGVTSYYYFSQEKPQDLPKQKVADLVADISIMDDDMKQTFTDDSTKKVNIDSIGTNQKYWKGKPQITTTKVKGTMLMYGKAKDSLPTAKNPYFKNAPYSEVMKKWGELTQSNISVNFPDSLRFTGLLSDFKRDVLGMGKEEATETAFTGEKKAQQ